MELTEFIEKVEGCYLIAMRASKNEDFEIVIEKLKMLEKLIEIGDKGSATTIMFSIYHKTLHLVVEGRLTEIQEAIAKNEQ